MLTTAMAIVAASCLFSMLFLIIATARALDKLEQENELLPRRIAEASRDAALDWTPANRSHKRPRLHLVSPKGGEGGDS